MFKRSPDVPAGDAADAVQQARTRARRRLIGAVILLGIGIIGFPLVFETRPRPIPIDIPIEIPRKENAPPLAMPPARSRATTDPAAPGVTNDVITESSADGGREVTPAGAASTRGRTPSAASSVSAPVHASPSSSAAHMTAAASALARGTSVASASPPTATAATAPASVAAPASGAARAQALLEGKPASAAEGGRYVVQVGAFAEADSAREALQKGEKMGLKTYTQVAQTPSGNRIRVRVGPFASRAEADAALAKAKAGGFSAVVLTL